MQPLASIALLAWALAAPEAPLVIVIDLPAAVGQQQSDTIAESVTLSPAPTRPASDAPESEWVTFRAAETAWQAAKLEAEALRQAQKDAQAAAHAAGRARRDADRRAAAAALGIEAAVTGLRTFRVLGPRATRRALGERTQLLVGCQRVSECVAPWAKELGAHYVLTVAAPPEDDPVLAWWVRLDETTQVVSEGELEPGQSASTLIAEMYEPVRLGERDAALAAAERAALSLAWDDARGWAERAIVLDPDSGAARFAAGRAAFELGDTRSARRHLDAAIERGHQLGEAHHLQGLIALRRSVKEAAIPFAAAIEAGRESLEGHMTLAAVSTVEPPGDNAEAMQHLTRALALAPGHGEASFLLGQLTWRNGRGQEARPLLEAAIRGGYQSGEAHHLLGQIAVHDGRNEDAVRHFTEARALAVTDLPALLVLARAWASTDPAAAAAAYAEARRRGEKDPQIDLELGRAALAAGETSTAAAALRRAARAEAHAGAANDQLGRMYAAQGNRAMAARYFGAALRAQTDSYEARIALAEIAAGARRHAEALEHFTAALAQRPKDGPASLGCAAALLALDRPEEARSHLLQAVRAGHQPALAHEWLAALEDDADHGTAALEHLRAAEEAGSVAPEIYRRLARRTKGPVATGYWQRLLELLPRDAEASFALGVEAHQSGSLPRAIALLTPLTASRTWRGEAHWRLGQIAAQEGDAAMALEHFERTGRYRPADFDLLLASGKSAWDAGRLDLAHGYLTRALAFRPNDGKNLLWLGQLELARKRISEARAYLGRALDTGFHPAVVHHTLGLAHWTLGEIPAARTHFAAAAGGGIESARGELTLAEADIDAKRTSDALEHLAAAARRARIERDPALWAEALSRGRELAEDPDAFEKRIGPSP